MAERTTIRVTEEGRCLTITLTPPVGKPPTLDSGVVADLEGAMDEVENALAQSDGGARPRLLVVQSASPKYFCAGANVAVLRTLNVESMPDWVSSGQQLLHRLEDLPIPIVAKVRGYALGGGLELAMAADFIFCDETARLGLTEARLGFVPGWGGSFRLFRRVGAVQAKRLFFTAAMVEAQEALALGLVDAVEKPEALDARVTAFGDSVEAVSELAVRGFKRMALDEERAARDRWDAGERDWSQECVTNTDTTERVEAFLNRRK